jgi:putative peptidoglycan lipid II flippase
LTNKSITKATGIVTIFSVLSLLFNFLVSILIAKYFGAQGKTDAFFMAMSIPDMVLKIFQLGTISIIFVPIFTEYLVKNKENEAWDFVNIVLNFIMFLFVPLILICIIFAPQIVSLIAPGFDVITKILTIKLARILFPNFFLILLSGILISIFTSYKEFTLTAITQALRPVLVILLLFFSYRTIGIFSLGFGNVFASLSIITILVFALFKKGFRYKFTTDFNHPEFRAMLILVVPFIFQAIVAQSSTIINNIIISFLGKGSLSYLNYADKIVGAFSVFLFTGLPLVIFPVFAEEITIGNINKLKNLALKSVKILQTLTVPICIFLAVFSRPLIQLVFERKAFSSVDTQMTSQVLYLHIFTLIFTGYNVILTKILYAMRETKQLALISIVSIVVFLTVALILVRPLGLQGLVCAGLASGLVTTAGTTMAVQKKYPGFCKGYYGIHMIKLLIITLLSLILVYPLYKVLFVTYQGINIYLKMIGLASIIGLEFIVFGILGIVFKVEEIKIIIGKLKTFFVNKKAQEVTA